MHLDDSTLPGYLRRIGLFAEDEPLRVEQAGSGNINYVRRVIGSDHRSVVVKHARPTLERFPEYEAPPERLVFEHRFLSIASARLGEHAALLPRVLHFDSGAPLLVLEDLVDATPLDTLLGEGAAPEAAFRHLGRLLGALECETSRDARVLQAEFRNDAMRSLHGEHIFTLPYEPDAFDIDPRVRCAADELLARPGVRDRIHELRDAYYELAESLVHADVQPTNVLLQGDRPRLLDAEIAHVGDPAFDLGTALAHLYVHQALGHHPAAIEKAIDALLLGHVEGGGSPELEVRARGHAGVEMLRRTLGAARIPWVERPEHAVAVLKRAIELLEGS